MGNTTQEFDPKAGKATQELVQTAPVAVQAPVVQEPAPVAMQAAIAPAPVVPIVIEGMRDKPYAQTSITGEALVTKTKLASEPKVMMNIPLDAGEKKGAYRAVTINGYRCEVKKGVMVNLPLSIARILMNSYNIESSVLSDNENNLNNADAARRAALNA